MASLDYTYAATVDRWVDGDTVDLRVDLGFHLSMLDRFRLAGVDTPERGAAGYLPAVERVNALAPVGSLVTVRTGKGDKYGRWLATVSAGGVVVNEALVSEGLAVPYFGGSKGGS